jgi:AcrR family transcriptional regulator
MRTTVPARNTTTPRPRRRKEDVLTDFRRRSLLDAARRVFGRDGFDAATVEAIARQADVAKGTVYLYYASKQAIFDAAFRDCMLELERLTRERVEAAPTLRDAVTAFVTTRGEFFRSRPDFFRMYVAEIAGQLTPGRKRRRPCRTMLDRQIALLREAIGRAMEAGEIRPVEADATATAIFDMTRGMVSRHILSAGEVSPARDAQVLTDLLWTGLAPVPTQD